MARSAARRSPRIASVVLAAGGSRRLGAPKQLVRRGLRPLLVRAVDAARSAVPGAAPIVVLGAHALRLRSLLRRHAPDARIVYNAGWRDGLAGSLRTGVGAVPRDAAAILVLLVDQPNVGAAALGRLLEAWQRQPGVPAAALYGGRPGVPAVWPRSSRRVLRTLRGDTGARAILRGAGRLTLVPMPEAEVDIDEPADLERLRRLEGA
jgi:molybdenum cofactor cytidylyltransferase